MAENETSVKPLEGKTAIDDKMFFEPERLSYECATVAAAKIAACVETEIESGSTVVIAGTQLLSDFANLQAAYATLDSVTREYEGIASLGGESMEPSEGLEGLEGVAISATALTAAIGPTAALVNAALGLVSFFREDVEYHGAKTTVDSLAFEISLASHLRKLANKDLEVVIPDLRIDSTVLTDEGSLTFRLTLAQNAKKVAWRLIGPMIAELAQLEAQLERVAQEGDQAEFDRLSTSISELRRAIEPFSEPLSRCDQQLADLQRTWNKRDETSGVSELARLLRAETILNSNPIYLHAKVISSGGHHRVSRSLLRSIFVGDGLTFMGGVTVRWALLDAEGHVLKGGILVRRAKDSSQSWSVLTTPSQTEDC